MNRLKRIELTLEVIGMAVALTAAQMVAAYLFLRMDTFNTFKSLFFSDLNPFKYLYLLFIYVMSRLFGPSFLNWPAYWKVFNMAFFTVFVVNLLYFAYSRYSRSK
jgi:hypothetical protein